jgi:predicted nucleotide-binding protein
VHGHDDGAKQALARFLEQIGAAPIVLHEQPNGGRTLIEKLEHFGEVSFALVLLTPDDVGSLNAERPALRTRARQNVLLELGYFIGKLGRARVCALYKGIEELPSDIVGVVYVEMDDRGAWKMEIARELKAAGYSINANALV